MKIYKKYEEIINYIIIGLLTTIVSLFTYYLLTDTFLKATNALYLQIATIVSWIVSSSFAYVANRYFVFKMKNKSNIKEAINFYLSRVSTLLIEMVLMYLLVSVLKFNDKIIKIVVQIIIVSSNYILSKFFVFKKNK